jgi:hypothetical protein
LNLLAALVGELHFVLEDLLVNPVDLVTLLQDLFVQASHLLFQECRFVDEFRNMDVFALNLIRD